MPDPIYGMKTSQVGHSVLTAADRYLNFDSRFDTLKIKTQGTSTLTHSTRTRTIAHGLGYVPAFMVHIKVPGTDGYFLSPVQYERTFYGPPPNNGIISWADSTNIYIKAQDDVGWKKFYTSSADDCLEGSSALGEGTSWVGVGNSGTWGDMRGAIRFNNVTLNQGQAIQEAVLGLNLYNDPSGDVPVTTTGIDEDNTGDFADLNFSRSKTSAYSNETASGSFNAGDTWAFGVTSIVQEIIVRGGWSNGNSMGFYLDRNGGASGRYIESYYLLDNYLKVRDSNDIADIKYTIFYNKLV